MSLRVARTSRAQLVAAARAAGLPAKRQQLAALAHFCRRLGPLQAEIDASEHGDFVTEIAYAISGVVRDDDFAALRRFDVENSPGWRGFRPAMTEAMRLAGRHDAPVPGELVHLYVRHMARLAGLLSTEGRP